jgi:hypothetical protein
VIVDESRAAIEKLLENFVTVALGLTIEAQIHDGGAAQGGCRGRRKRSCKAPVRAVWRTDRGPLSACARYDHVQSQRAGAHVLWIAWWLAPDEHHEGWWHCYPKRPHEWIKGIGTRLGSQPDIPPS